MRGLQSEISSESQDGPRTIPATDSPSGRKATGPSRSTAPKSHPLTQTMKTKELDLPGSYVSVLSSAPPDTTQRTSIVIGDDPSAVSTSRREIDVNNSSDVWSYAMELAGTGQIDEASKFFKIHEALSLAKKSKEATADIVPSREARIEAGVVSTTKQNCERAP